MLTTVFTTFSHPVLGIEVEAARLPDRDTAEIEFEVFIVPVDDRLELLDGVLIGTLISELHLVLLGDRLGQLVQH